MTRYHQPRSRRTPPRGDQPRHKRALIVLTYRDDQLAAIHSSTLQVQFVRVDVLPPAALETLTTEVHVPLTARQLAVPRLCELPTELLHAAQAAFRRS
ncbi:MAG: hypothetical protein JWN70_1285 [Planctomycetaceae bacterium]|nr:hypothetical protein [Planctomycetaceae bacterium]